MLTRQAHTDDATDADVIPDVGEDEAFFAIYRHRSIMIPGTMYPIGARTPMLPTMPNESARMLWMTDIKVAHPKILRVDAATIRNIREKPVAIPPGI